MLTDEKSSSRSAKGAKRNSKIDAFLAESDMLLQLENQLRAEGFAFIAGVDEAGRGPLAGPVVAAAVMFPAGAKVPAVFDSKQLSEDERKYLRDAILRVPDVRYGVVEMGVEVIDELNILRANDRAMREAVAKLGEVDFILVDGRPVPYLPAPSKAVVKGDSLSASIAAASILAKVWRDELMEKYAVEYPGYGFEVNKGYGTAEHLRALQELGVSPIHRRSFSPIKEMLNPASQLELW